MYAMVVKTNDDLITTERSYRQRANAVRKVINETLPPKYTIEQLHSLFNYNVVFIMYPDRMLMPNHTNRIYFKGGAMWRIPCGEMSLHTGKRNVTIAVDKHGRMWGIKIDPMVR